MKYLILLIVFTLSSPVMAQNKEQFVGTPTDCGEYKIAGVVRRIDDSLKIVVNEKTLSEKIISLALLESGKLGPYLDHAVHVSVMLNKKFDGTKAEASGITQAPSDRLPDPMNPQDTGFLLITPSPCIKQ